METQKRGSMNIFRITKITGLIFIITSFIVGFVIFLNSKSNNIEFTEVGTTIPESTQQPVAPSNPNFSEISQVDQSWMREIITGVIQNTTKVTPMLKNELRGIFKKYNMTDVEIDNFASYGPALAVVYQAYFFLDALQAVSSGNPVKSDARLNFEKEALSRGQMTSERIKMNDEEMKLIASHQPVIGLDGKKYIFTEENINSTLSNIGLITTRLQSLLTTAPVSNSNDNQHVSGNASESSEDRGCENLHGPSVYKTYPQSLGGGAYCDCKPGYTSTLITTTEGTPSSWCVKE